MAGDEDRPPPLRLAADQVADPADPGRVETIDRLVEQQNLGVAEQGGRDREPLAHPHRVALDPAVCCTGEPDQLEHLVDAGSRVPAGRGEHAEVVAAAAAGVKARVLEHRADAGARPVERLVAATVEPGAAGVGVQEAEQYPQRRALAGAVRPEEAGDPSLVDLEREVLDRLDAAKALADALDLDRRHGRQPTEASHRSHRAEG